MIKRILIFISVCAYIDFYGFLNTETFLHFKDLFKIYDLLIAMILLFLINCFLRHDRFLRYSIKTISSQCILLILSFILATALLTKIRYNETLFSSLKIARYYLPWIICIFCIYEISCSKSSKFVKNLILFNGSIMSAIYIIIHIYPSLLTSFLKGSLFVIYTDGGITFNRLYTSGFLFPVAALFILIVEILLVNKSASLPSLILFLTNLLGVFFQGFRVYILSTLFAAIFGVLLISKIKSGKMIAGFAKTALAFGVLLLIILNTQFSNSFFVSRISNGINDFVNKEGTYQGRIADNWYRRMLFQENILWGIGFVDAKSPAGQSMGLGTNNEFSAYSTDSGYLTLLVTFGISGFVFYSTLLLIISFRQYRLLQRAWCIDHLYSISAILFLIVMAISNITHAGLSSPYGLVPLCLLISIPEGGSIIAETSEYA